MFEGGRNGLVRQLGRWGWIVAMVVFWLGALRNVELPGLYMDAVNPDYLFARWLNPELKNPVWVLPTGPLPLLGNLYHGMQTLYVGVLTYGLLGTSVVSVRLTHAMYGSLIVLMTWLILRRVSGRPVLATVLAIALATDMAFIGSFRTQVYIVLAGQVWMMLSLWLALCSIQDAKPSRWLLLLSGVGMGLATYGYFVFLFFVPPVAALAVLGSGRQAVSWRMLTWGAGFAVGMLPYVVGYIELWVAVGGMGPLADWMRNTLGTLKPSVGRESYWEGLRHVMDFARWGLGGLGNESIMFDELISRPLVVWRVACMTVAGVICLLGAGMDWRTRPGLSKVLLGCAALPVVYIGLAAVFGSRLGVHHFMVLVAISYLLLGLAVYWLALRLPQGRVRSVVTMLLAVVLLTVNIVQQNRVQARLVATGGTGMSTDALPALARTALAEKTRSVWFFPEWGFFMPFAFLTANQVPYENELTVASLNRLAVPGKEVRVAFWQEKQEPIYREVLEQADIQDIQLRRMHRRDGRIALYVLSGLRP